MVFYLVKRLLKGGKITGFRFFTVPVATGGIFLACCFVVVGLGVLAGYQKVYRDAVLNFSSHIIVFRDTGLTVRDRQDLEFFLNHSKIAHEFSPYHFSEALVPSAKGLKPVIFKGVDAEKMRKVYPVVYEMFDANVISPVFAGKDLLRIQPEMAKTHELKYLLVKGGRGGRHTRFGSIPVRGTFESGYYDFDSRFVLVPLEELSEHFGQDATVSGYEIRLKDIALIESMGRELVRHFDRRFDILTWQELNQSLFEALLLDRTVIFSVSFLIIMIAALNLFGFNFLFFIQRRREFFILHAMGLRLSRLRRVMILLSLLFGGVSSVLGAGAGMVVLKFLAEGPGIRLDPAIYFVDRVPVLFQQPWFAAFVAGTVVLCVLTGYFASKTLLTRHKHASLEI